MLANKIQLSTPANSKIYNFKQKGHLAEWGAPRCEWKPFLDMK